MTEIDIAFASEGATLRGWLVVPDGPPRPRPAVVMAHGTSATVAMVAIEYARAFGRAGIVALVYDHRNFGRSGGEPRGEINPWVQCRGYRDAIGAAASRPEVDPARIALWGDSYSGGEAIVVAACDERVRAVVVQCPVFGPTPPAVEPAPDEVEAIRRTLLDGDVRGTPETTTGPIAVVSFDPASVPSLLAPPQAFRWFFEYGGRPGSGWVNRASRVLPPTPVPYSPYACAAAVHVPVMMMVAPDDEMAHANPTVARRAFERLPRSGHRWVEIADGHFGLLYHPGPRFDAASAAQSAFLGEVLKP